MGETNRYMPQIDSLRALAVFAVMVHHFDPSEGYKLAAVLGVKFFFVLSGFLITRILLADKSSVEAKRSTIAKSLCHFYARRFLRIFPLYYFVVALGLVFAAEATWEILPYLLTYTLNIHMAVKGWYVEYYAHFWTLAVEEQFYLVWPAVILFMPRRFLLVSILAGLFAGPLYRLAALLNGTGLGLYINTPASLDSLGAGALLALFSAEAKTAALFARFALAAGTLGLARLLLFPAVPWQADIIFSDLAYSLIFVWIIFCASQKIPGPGKLLDFWMLRYLGKISYGMYVYHPFMPYLCVKGGSLLGWSLSDHPFYLTALSAASTVLASSISWRVIESPLINLKRCLR
jgi:peptidoglycan/LPS O-acetylase OafA/YrhL